MAKRFGFNYSSPFYSDGNKATTDAIDNFSKVEKYFGDFDESDRDFAKEGGLAIKGIVDYPSDGDTTDINKAILSNLILSKITNRFNGDLNKVLEKFSGGNEDKLDEIIELFMEGDEDDDSPFSEYHSDEGSSDDESGNDTEEEDEDEVDNSGTGENEPMEEESASDDDGEDDDDDDDGGKDSWKPSASILDACKRNR